MKKFVPFLLAAMLVLPTLTQAKIWRVNNNAGVVADFNTLDGAMAAYAAGDTIHLEPSATAYTETGNLFNQNNGFVTIIGNGYSLSPTQNPGLQQETLSSQINSTSTEVGIKSFIKFIGIFLYQLQSRLN